MNAPERPVAPVPAAASPDRSSHAPAPTRDDAGDGANDDASRRAALRDLAAMIGVEVFY